MILATGDDLNYPHTDWMCSQCGMVYSSHGLPDDSRCLEGHDAAWVPEEGQMESYIEALESLEAGDGVLFAGRGPAALMGPVKEVGDGWVITESIDSPSRKIRWSGGKQGDYKIEQANLEREHEMYDRVYHIDTVDIQTAHD